MKHKQFIITLGSATVTATAFAGTPATVTAPPPAPAPCLTEWFIGGSFGQLNDVDNNLLDLATIEFDNYRNVEVGDLDFDMYTLHAGRGIACVGGFDIAAYLEVAYLDGDVSGSAFNSAFSVETFDFDVEMIPVTANIMAERTIYGPVSFYVTAGVGYAWTDVSEGGDDKSDGGFYAQASAGLIYNINESFEIFGGARWVYLDSVDFAGDFGFELDSSFAWEVGLRYNF